VTAPAFRCLVCHEARSEPVFLDCEDYYLRKPFRADYHRCAGCGLLQQFPVPLDVSPFYEDYPIHQHKSGLYELARNLLMSPAYFDARRLSAGAQLLDYGCGDGSYLAAERGRGHQLLGFENDAPRASQLTDDLGLPVHSDMSGLLKSHGGKLDGVTMHFVLEHLTDPVGAFDEVSRLLKPGGVFYFVVPQPDSLEARLFGRKWHNLDPPRHISFPDVDTVAGLARRHRFVVERHAAVPIPTGFAASVPVLLTGRFSLPLFMLSMPLGVAFSRLAPQGSRAFWLVRS
jgi:SAM-dependent methyltransferase